MRSTLALVVLVGCGGGSGSAPDASADAPYVPPTINIAGVASEVGLGGTTAVANVVVSAYSISDPNTPVAQAMTDVSGNYGMQITTNGQPLDGYLKAVKSGYVVTYLYPPAPMIADFTQASLNMLTSGTLGALYTFAQVSQGSGMGTIALEVVDTQMATLPGVTVSSAPAGAVKYNAPNSSYPSSSAMATQSDGIAYILNVPPGSVMVSATKTGLVFKSHSVVSYAGQLTTTVISE